MILPGARMDRQRREDTQKINQALESAQRILNSDSPVSLEEIDEALKILQNAERNGFPFTDTDVIRRLEDKRGEVRERALDDRPSWEKAADDAELRRINAEIKKIEDQIKELDKKAAKTLLGKIMMGVSAVLGTELSGEKEKLVSRLRELYRQRQEVKKE